MIINVERNNIFITNEAKQPFIKASLEFQRVTDPSNPHEVGIIPIFFIYVTGFDNTDECKNLYQEYYKELLVVMAGLMPDVYYVNYFQNEEIWSLKESIIQQEGRTPVKVPTLTNFKIYND